MVKDVNRQFPDQLQEGYTTSKTKSKRFAVFTFPALLAKIAVCLN